MISTHVDEDRPEVDGIGDERRLFAFEADFARDLRCIPMVVRYKLDACGIKLSLRQWSRMGAANRALLLVQRCNRHTEVNAYRETVVRLARTHCTEEMRWLPLDPAPAWADARHVPTDVIRQATALGIVPPSPQAWSQLSTLQRFALLKLARSDHDNHNFVPAMREMSLIST